MTQQYPNTPKNGDPAGRAAGEAAAASRAKASEHDSEADADVGKGAVESEQPRSATQANATQTSMAGQIGHRASGPQPVDSESSAADLKESDSDFPEPGSNPEHSGQHR